MKNNSKNGWKIIGGICSLLLLFTVAFLIWFFYTGSSDKIVAAANQFKPDPSWKLEYDTVVPPGNVCIDVECPSISRTWKTNNPVTKDVLINTLSNSNIHLTFDSECLEESNLYTSICSAQGHESNYTYNLYIDNKPNSNSTIRLYVTE